MCTLSSTAPENFTSAKFRVTHVDLFIGCLLRPSVSHSLLFLFVSPNAAAPRVCTSPANRPVRDPPLPAQPSVRSSVGLLQFVVYSARTDAVLSVSITSKSDGMYGRLTDRRQTYARERRSKVTPRWRVPDASSRCDF
jgi:hypothetical protein